MPKSFVDTTILVDYLFKRGLPNFVAAKTALARYSANELPEYAVRELCYGVLSHYIWFHNKLATTERWHLAMSALSVLFKQPNKVSTILEAVAAHSSEVSAQLPEEERSQADGLVTGELRRWLEVKIKRSLRACEQKPFEIVHRLSCLEQPLSVEMKNRVFTSRPECTLPCGLVALFRSDPASTKLLSAACRANSAKYEMAKRAKALDATLSASSKIGKRECRNLGDAVFALLCPPASVLLTTNAVDHKVLAAALSKNVETP